MRLTMGHGVNLSRLSDGLICLLPPLRINQVRRENGIDKSRLSKPGLTYMS